MALVPWWSPLTSHRFPLNVQPMLPCSEGLIVWFRGRFRLRDQWDSEEQQLQISLNPGPNQGEQPFPRAGRAPGSPPSMARSLGLSLDGGRRPRHIGKNFLPFHSHRTSSWHKKCQSTGDWLNNWDLVSSFKVKITYLQITTCSLNNTAQVMYGTLVRGYGPRLSTFLLSVSHALTHWDLPPRGLLLFSH